VVGLAVKHGSEPNGLNIGSTAAAAAAEEEEDVEEEDCSHMLTLVPRSQISFS
jgi:hypothetical protein